MRKGPGSGKDQTSGLRLGLRAAFGAAAAVGHELVKLGLVLGLAQALEELAELALLLFEPLQGLGAVLVEGVIAARLRPPPPAAPAALAILHSVPAAGAA